MSMERYTESGINISIPLLANIATATQIIYKGYSSGEVFVPATVSLTTLTWYGSPDGITYYPLYQDGGTTQFTSGTPVATAVTSNVVATGCGVPIPIGAMGCAYLKAVGNVATTGVVTLKE